MLAVPLTDYYEEVRRYLTCPEEVKDDLNLRRQPKSDGPKRRSA